MYIDWKDEALVELAKHYPCYSQEYQRIQLLMFGYTDEEIDEKLGYNTYDDPYSEIVERIDYPNICAGSIMRDDYFEHHFNNKDNMSVILECMSNHIMTDSY